MNSDFARRQLEKHGWTDGDGLGRRRNGMSQPIKVNLKMDKTGVGHDPGKEFTDHWWMKAFNEAAKKIKKADEPQQKEETEESKRKAEMSSKRKNFYKGFVKASTLTNGCETKNSDRSSSEDEDTEEKDITSVPTLDDLHKFCGGATGHRAARFGIKMKGKLSRVAAHDEEFEQQSKVELGILYVKKGKDGNNANLSFSDTQTLDGDSGMSANTTDRKQFTEKEIQKDTEALHETLVPPETDKKKKKKKRKREKDDDELDDAVENTALDLTAESGLNKETGRKKKKKRKTDTLVEESPMNDCDSVGKGEIDDERHLENDKSDEPESQDQLKTKRKKKKAKDQDEEVLPTINNVDEESVRKEKRKKKRKIKDEESFSEEITNISSVQESNLRDNVQINDPDKLNGVKNKEKSNDGNVEIPRKKKKKSQDSNISNIDLPLSNDSSDTSSKKKQSKKAMCEMDVPENGISEETVRKEKKKKKKSQYSNHNFEDMDLPLSNDSSDTSSKKKQSKKAKGDMNVPENEISEETVRKEKKKKRRKNKDCL